MPGKYNNEHVSSIINRPNIPRREEEKNDGITRICLEHDKSGRVGATSYLEVEYEKRCVNYVDDRTSAIGG